MSVQTLRRYLQPSPVLRWHPWAPLTALAAALVVTFALGVYWARAAADRGEWSYAVARASQTQMHYLLQREKPARGLVEEAAHLDNMVILWTRMRGEPASWVPFKQKPSPDLKVEQVRAVAEFRLKELSGLAPRWQATSTYCSEFSAHGSTPELMDRRLAEAAAAYTAVLGRQVTPQQLAPAVPGHRCAA